jgi:hypothetical protein
VPPAKAAGDRTVDPGQTARPLPLGGRIAAIQTEASGALDDIVGQVDQRNEVVLIRIVAEEEEAQAGLAGSRDAEAERLAVVDLEIDTAAR